METLHKDALIEILSSVENRELIIFSNSQNIEFSKRVIEVLQDNDFWKKRLEFTLGRVILDETSSNWKKRYLNYLKVMKSKILIVGLMEVADNKLLKILSDKLSSYEEDNKKFDPEEQTKLADIIVDCGKLSILQTLIRIGYLNIKVEKTYLELINTRACMFNHDEDVTRFLVFSYIFDSSNEFMIGKTIFRASEQLFRDIIADIRFNFIFEHHGNKSSIKLLSCDNLLLYVTTGIERGFDLNMVVIVKAVIENRDLKTLITLLEKGLIKYNFNYLLTCVTEGRYYCFKYLLQYEENKNFLEKLLTKAASKGYYSMVRDLSEKLNYCYFCPHFLFSYAIENKHAKMFEYLLEHFPIDSGTLPKIGKGIENYVLTLLKSGKVSFDDILSAVDFKLLDAEAFTYIINNPDLKEKDYDKIYNVIFFGEIIAGIEPLISSPYFKTKNIGDFLLHNRYSDEFLFYLTPYISSFVYLYRCIEQNCLKSAMAIAKNISFLDMQEYEILSELLMLYGHDDILEVVNAIPIREL